MLDQRRAATRRTVVRRGTARARVRPALLAGALVAVASLVLGVVAPGVAWAWWSSSSTTPNGTLSAATVPVQPKPTCAESGVVNVKMSWTDTGSVPSTASRSYALVIRSGSTVVKTIDPYVNGANVTPDDVNDTRDSLTATVVTKYTFAGVAWTSVESPATTFHGDRFLFVFPSLDCG